MRKPLVAVIAAAILVLGAAAPAASAKERVLTLYSPKIDSLPYVHDTHEVTLKPDGVQAPATPGYITGWKEMALVDSKNPKAKPLPIAKMMVHHFLYFAPGTQNTAPGSCWGRSGFIGGRGEEHPLGHTKSRLPASTRRKYGIVNRTAAGTAPAWRLTAMVMNHYKRPKSFYVRTRVYYTTERRREIQPIVLGDCSHLLNGMSYDVPGGGRKGSNFVSKSDWTVPAGMNGRLLVGASHQHGGAKYQVLESRTCGRRIYKAPAYYGPPDHVYNTIRPILHEPGPVGNGTFATAQGVPVTEGEVLRRVAVHDNHNLHVASMGFWSLWFLPDDSVKRCGKMPTDMVDINRPKRFDRTPNYDLKVPQLAKPASGSAVFSGAPLEVGDDFFRPGRITSKPGQTVSWSFGGLRPHSVTVANGPRGFSSVYWGRRQGTYSVTPTVKGTYRLVCLVHPTTMAQTLVVKD
jgi:plastocyanin